MSPGRKKLRKRTEVAICETCEGIVEDPELDKTHFQDSKELPEHLQVILEKSKHLSPSQQKELKQLLREEQDIFSKSPQDLGRSTVVKHAIDTKDAPPIKQYPRRLPIGKFEEADRTVKDMLENDVIEPSSSPWCSPIVLVKKKDGSTRFCVDYRKLNAVTQKDAYPLPRLDATLDSLSGSNWFSTLDMKAGYWQVEMEERSKEFTAFSHGKGLWQFKVMPFGLCNSAPTFQRLMEVVLSQLPIETVLVYIDDILVHGKEFDEEVKNLKLVFQRIREANLKLNPKKCVLFAKEVNYLGHIVSGSGISVDPAKVQTIQDWPIPTCSKEVRTFVGLCSYYRRFIWNFAEIAKPLHKLTEKNKDFSWNEDCDIAFESLKTALQESPILTYPDTSKKYILDTDASKCGIGAVLSQITDGKEHVIAYYSRTLSKQEENYCVTRRELLAVVNAVEHFNAYLYGSEFELRTDHSALQWLLTFKNPKDQLARWLAKLQQYTFKVIHRAGRKHGNADALSRRPCVTTSCRYCEKREIEDGMTADQPVGSRKVLLVQNDEVDQDTAKEVNKGKCWTTNELQDAQWKDPVLSHIMQWLQVKRRPSWNEISHLNPTVKGYWAQWDSLELIDGVLHRRLENPCASSIFQLVVPHTLQADVLREMHDEPTGGHLGVAKTLSRLKNRFYWIHSRRDVENWCKRCEPCAKRKGPQKRNKAPLKTYVSGAPMERWAVDILGPLPRSQTGNKYLMIVGDYFTKWMEAIPLPNQEAKTVADALVTQLVTRFGVPKQLHSDQGRNFESKVFSEMCTLLGIQKTRTTPYRPQSDGMVERFNRTLEDQIAKYVEDHQTDWDRHVPYMMMAYRSATHQATGESPSKLVFGREIRLPIDLMFGCRDEQQTNVDDYVRRLESDLEEAHDFARLNLKCSSEKMKTRYDINAASETYKPGEAVRYCVPRRRKGITPKFQSNWDGPYLVRRRINDLIYEIQRAPRARTKIVHKDRLCKFNRKHPEWFATVMKSKADKVDKVAEEEPKPKTSEQDQAKKTTKSKPTSKEQAEMETTTTDRTRLGKRPIKLPVKFQDYHLKW